VPTWNPERWRAVSPYLDELLGMGPDRRAEWLRRISTDDEALHADLERLLAEYDDILKSRFLESILDWPARRSR
jgi:hypothetical protein